MNAPTPRLGYFARWRRSRTRLALVAGFVLACSGWTLHGNRSQTGDPPHGVLPGEFEIHESLLLGWNEPFPPDMEAEAAGVIREAATQMKLVLLNTDSRARQQALRLLQENNVQQDRVTFLPIGPTNIWARDFGPHVVKSFNGTTRVLNVTGIHVSPSDQEIPYRLATQWGFPFQALKVVLEGGNLLSNGSGVVLTTTAAIDWNRNARVSRAGIERLLRTEFGGEEVIFLEPMHGEPCGHVDMFCTFTSPNVVVVGQYDPAVDPVNAALLDRNAERLRQVQTARGKLRVERIPMPRRQPNPLRQPVKAELWYTYTNVVYANGKLLMPSYKDVDPKLEEQALAVYRRLLPDWQVIPLPSDALLKLNGSLHCLTMNVYRSSR
jgi:agmatine/peptidylarginine deiminase